MRYSLTASYPPAHEWGQPEQHLTDALDKAIHAGAVSEYLLTEAGTDLATGRRDVEFVVSAEHPDALHRVIDSLESPAERRLWVIFPYDQERGFHFTTGYGPSLSVVSDPADLDDELPGYSEHRVRAMVKDGPITRVELPDFDVSVPILREEYRVIVTSPLGTDVNVGREYADCEEAETIRDAFGPNARIQTRLISDWT